MSSTECYPEKARKVDAILDALSHHLRREVIHYFENFSDDMAATFDELAAHVTARVPDRDRENLSMKLIHIHLPRLQEDGWLEFDRRSEEIRYYGHEAVPRLLIEVTEVFTD